MRSPSPTPPAHRSLSLLLAAVLAFAGTVAARASGGADLAWPPGDPRVHFEEVIELRSGKLGKTLRKLTGKREASFFQRPYGIAWDGDELLVTDPGAGRVVRITARGRVRESLRGELASPIGVAVCPAGVVVTDSRTGSVALLATANLRPRRRLAEGLERPTGVACSATEIFVAETGAHRIVVLAEDGVRRSLGRRGAGKGELNFPTSLAFDGQALWVGDTLNFRLQRLDPATGEPLAAFGRLGDAAGEMPRLKGVAVDREGNLWVADAHLDQVALYRPDGTFLMDLGRTGARPGEFSFPAGIAAHPDGRVAVVDSLNRRLQLFRAVNGTGNGK